ncbi:MAG: NAD(P)H-dependent oxidoreductase [Longimicrobiales bacterium]
MILVDKALEERAAAGKPLRVGMVGAGFMARGSALRIVKEVPGMDLVAIANRTLPRTEQIYADGGVSDVARVTSVSELERAIEGGRPAVTEDPQLLCEAGPIDVILEITGAVEYGAHVAMAAIRNGKHFVTMNAELDGTVGPILKALADQAGVVFSGCDGDQPGVEMNLYRFVKGIGVRPVLCGNIKGLHDPYRNPTTQEGFAKQWGQNVHMVTSFADGTKISFEQAIVANATGMTVGQRGMFGPTVEPGTSIEEAAGWYPEEALLEGPGIVDYVVAARPGPGVYVIGTHDDPIHQHYLNLYKMGEGPLYCFYTPYHLCHFEAPNSVARAALFGDAAIASIGGPMVDVVATAKVDLADGDEIDALGGYKTYGLAEKAEVTATERLLPIGLAEGCRVIRPVVKDAVLTYDDVELPEQLLSVQLRRDQDEKFGLQSALVEAAVD